MFKNKSQKGSVLVITVILISLLLILLGGLTSAVLISKNSNISISNKETLKIESNKDAYYFYNELVIGNEANHEANIKLVGDYYFITGFDSSNTYETTLKVENVSPFKILDIKVEGVK